LVRNNSSGKRDLCPVTYTVGCRSVIVVQWPMSVKPLQQQQQQWRHAAASITEQCWQRDDQLATALRIYLTDCLLSKCSSLWFTPERALCR